MDHAFDMIEDLNYLLSAAVDTLGWLVLVASMTLFTCWTLHRFILFISCLWRGDPQWRDYGFEIMMTSEFFRIAYFLNQHVDQSVDKIDERADLIDKAISKGKDPFKAVKDAGL